MELNKPGKEVEKTKAKGRRRVSPEREKETRKEKKKEAGRRKR